MGSVYYTIICATLASVPLTSYAFFFGPKNYDDCILQNMKGVTSDEAAVFIYDSCTSKFPKDGVADKNKPHYKYVDPKGVQVCKLHYTGTRLLVGENKSPPYITFKAERFGTQRIVVSLPRDIAQEKNYSVSNFLEKNSTEIYHLCGF